MARASYLTSARHGTWCLATGLASRRPVEGFSSTGDSCAAISNRALDSPLVVALAQAAAPVMN